MIPLGLNARDKRQLIETLFNHHQMRVRVQSTTLDGGYDADLTNLLLDGQVNIDWTEDVTRSASVTLLDPNGVLSFDSDSPTEASVFLDRMIRIWYGVRVDYGEGFVWQDIPIFTGPIIALSRSGNTVDVEAQGKEVLAMGAAWKPLTIRKDTPKVTAIRTILRERAGETRFDFPNLKAQMPTATTLGRRNIPWLRARRIARSMGGRQLFYDGRGVCRLRRLPENMSALLGPGSMLSEVSVSYSQEDTVNAVFVQGGVPKGQKVPVSYELFAAARHPLSPWRLGRTNRQGVRVPRYLMEVIEDENIRSRQEAFRVARDRLRRGLLQAIDASFDIIPLPMLEPGDLVTANTEAGTVTFRPRAWSIPLSAGQPMSLGYLKNVAPRRRHGRIGVRYRGTPYTAEFKAARQRELARLAAERARAAKKRQQLSTAKKRRVMALRKREMVSKRRYEARRSAAPLRVRRKRRRR